MRMAKHALCTGHAHGRNLQLSLPHRQIIRQSVSQSITSVIGETAAWAVEHRGTETLRNLLQTHGSYVYGAGGFGRKVAAALAGQGNRVVGFIDAFTDGSHVAGLPCHKPEEIGDTAGAVLIVAVNNFKTPVEPVLAWARTAGFAEILHVAELPDVVDSSLGQYWQASRRLISDCAHKLAALDRLLADDRSHEILAALARYRITGLAEDHPPVDRERQYFPADLPLGRAALNVIDCGAFPGDMLSAVKAAGHRLENWYAFEPDPANFSYLSRIAAQTGGFTSASLFPCGVGDRAGMMRFSDGAGDASRALEGGDTEDGLIVPIVRVDDVIHADRVDLVKLDVEGFEASAIDGMAQLLDRHRPRLALAVYHKPTDLWDIAFKLDAKFPGGRYALRQHGYNGYDTVLYIDW